MHFLLGPYCDVLERYKEGKPFFSLPPARALNNHALRHIKGYKSSDVRKDQEEHLQSEEELISLLDQLNIKSLPLPERVADLLDHLVIPDAYVHLKCVDAIRMHKDTATTVTVFIPEPACLPSPRKEASSLQPQYSMLFGYITQDYGEYKELQSILYSLPALIRKYGPRLTVWVYSAEGQRVLNTLSKEDLTALIAQAEALPALKVPNEEADSNDPRSRFTEKDSDIKTSYLHAFKGYRDETTTSYSYFRNLDRPATAINWYCRINGSYTNGEKCVKCKNEPTPPLDATQPCMFDLLYGEQEREQRPSLENAVLDNHRSILP